MGTEPETNLTTDEAIALAKSGWWKDLPPDAITSFQLWEDKLCMDFADYHAAIKESLGRGVRRHEFAQPDLLKQEFLNERVRPSLSEIFDLVPDGVRTIFVAYGEGD